jgi:hypothetical protein
MAITWKINTLVRDLTQGDNENIITQIHWTASDSDADGNTGSSYGSVGVTLVGTPTAYADVTEADAIDWAKDALGDEQVTAIEASIASQIDALANPSNSKWSIVVMTRAKDISRLITDANFAGTLTVGDLTASSLNGGQFGGRRNIVINGAMQVAQRGTSVADIGASGGYFTTDRWAISVGETSAGRLTSAQVGDGPDGIANCTKLTCTTADTTIAAGELLQFQTKLEGQDLQQMNKGIASAKEVTVSFYVKGNAAATYSVEMHDRDNTRFNSQEFSVTTDWVRIVKTFAADADDGSSPYGDDNAVSMSLNFNLHGGSTYTGGSHTDNVWHEVVNQRLGDNATSFFDSTDRTFFITGVQTRSRLCSHTI